MSLYNTRDPFAIKVVLRAGASDFGDLSWDFARDLLVESFFELAGDGDVHVWVEHDDDQDDLAVFLELNNTTDTFLLRGCRADLTDLRHEIFELVPAGSRAS